MDKPTIFIIVLIIISLLVGNIVQGVVKPVETLTLSNENVRISANNGSCTPVDPVPNNIYYNAAKTKKVFVFKVPMCGSATYPYNLSSFLIQDPTLPLDYTSFSVSATSVSATGEITHLKVIKFGITILYSGTLHGPDYDYSRFNFQIVPYVSTNREITITLTASK